jgi:hypothetical protein
MGLNWRNPRESDDAVFSHFSKLLPRISFGDLSASFSSAKFLLVNLLRERARGRKRARGQA